MQTLKVVIGWTENNYSAVCEEKDIMGVVVATHKDLEALKQAFAEALQFHIEGCLEDGDILPEYLKAGAYELVFELQISAVLHKFDKMLTRSALSRATGINERQLGHYMSGHRKPRPDKQAQILAGIRKIGKELVSV